MDELNQLTNCPYVGLQPYTVKEHKYFFGRERDSRIISSNLFAAPLTVLYGASGVGKSSVLQAGVVPLLHKSPRTIVASFQRWPVKDPIQTLKNECLKSIKAAGYQNVRVEKDIPLDEFLLQATQAFHGSIMIILDQFEEYFLYHHETENTFDIEFAQTVNREEIDAHFLIALREDSLSMLDRFRTRIPNLLGNSLRLRHLDAASTREAIRKPLEVYNQEHPDKMLNIEDSLVEVLVQDVRAGKLLIGQGEQGRYENKTSTVDSNIRIEAPFLQLILTRLWEEEINQGSNVLRHETYVGLKGATEIVKTHLDHAMEDLPSEYQEIAANIFRYLVTPSGTKIAYTVQDLTYYYNESTTAVETTETLESVLNQLAQGNVRVLRRVALPGEPSRYEIYHDVLAPAILDWRRGKELRAKIRENTRKEIRNLLKWAALGALVDFIWTIFVILFVYVVPLLLLLSWLAIIPMGAFAFVQGLRKFAPYFQKEQIKKVILWWFGIRVPLSLVGIFLSFLSTLFTDSENIAEQISRIILIGVGVSTFLISGPLGGLWAYWRIRRKEN